jgi:hypothetical protein
MKLYEAYIDHVCTHRLRWVRWLGWALYLVGLFVFGYIWIAILVCCYLLVVAALYWVIELIRWLFG